MIKIGKPEPERFNILVVGPSNIGKKFFLQMLLGKYQIPFEVCSSKKLSKQFGTVSINHLSGISMEAAEGTLDIHLYISQGYGKILQV